MLKYKKLMMLINGGCTMNPFEIAGGIVLLLVSLIIIVMIMLQESKQAGGMNAVTGGASETFVGKNGGRTKDAFLAKLTKVLAITFFVVSIAVNLIVVYMK